MNINKLVKQLENISKKQKSEKTYSKSTQKRWENITNQAFDLLGLDKFKYLDKKTAKGQQNALSKSASTLSKKLQSNSFEGNIRKQVMDIVIKNLQNTEVTERTQNRMAGDTRNIMPELQDIDNMSLDRLLKARDTMQTPLEERAYNMVQQYGQEYFERYFKGIIDEPGYQNRIDEIVKHFGNDYGKLKDFMEVTESDSFKGGYGDTYNMLKINSDANIYDVMTDRLTRMETIIQEQKEAGKQKEG